MKILIVSYHYPPCNAVAGLRPKSFADNWSKNNEVKVITRKWKGDEKFPLDYLASNNGEIVRNIVNNQLEEIFLPFIKREVTTREVVVGLIKGNLTIDFETNQFKKFGIELCKSWQPDVIFVTSPPINILKLGIELANVSNSKLVADFRDFENHYIFGNKNEGFKSKIISKSAIYHTKKWLDKYHLISTVCEPFTDYFETNHQGRVRTIKNGFELDIFKDFRENQPVNKKFEVSLVGTMYKEQNPKLILEGLKLFLENKNDVVVNFIGTDKEMQISESIKLAIPRSKLILTSRIPRIEALAYMKKSNVLFYVGWIGYKGMYSGKIFEYLGARRTILIAPSDKDVIEKLMIETKAGVSVNTSEEVENFLNAKYDEWKLTGRVIYHGLENEIINYSRENQAKLLGNELLNLFH